VKKVKCSDLELLMSRGKKSRMGFAAYDRNCISKVGRAVAECNLI
jgi:hypothetical protein